MSRKHGKEAKDAFSREQSKTHTRRVNETEAEFNERARDYFVDTGHKHKHLGKRSKSQKSWHGDDDFYVHGQQADYVFWYEFLRDAHFDEKVKVDYEKYEAWGVGKKSIQETLDSMTAYAWCKHVFTREKLWRDLFAVSRRNAVEKLAAREIDDAAKDSIESENDLLVRISFTNKSKDDIDRQLRKLLRDEMRERGRLSGKRIKRDEAKFQITTSAGLDSLAFRRTIEIARLEKKLRANNKKLNITQYFTLLNKGKRKRAGRRGVFEELHLDEARSSNNWQSVRRRVSRDRIRYRDILKNVASGKFPGRYTK